MSNAGSSVTSDAASLELIDPYGSYIGGFGLDPENNGAPGENPDSDSLANSLEFLLGTDPTASDPPEDLPSARPVAGGIEYVFHRLKAASETGFTVEHTPDLAGEWTPAVNGVDEVTIVTATHERAVPRASKREIARAVLDEVVALRSQALESGATS